MPEHFIRDNTGQSPESYFSVVSYSGSHDRTAELVASGQFDVGAINYKVYERRIAEGQTDPRRVRVIWQTPPYPDYNFTAHPQLDAVHGEGFTHRLQQALVAMRDPTLLAAFPRERLIPARNEDFDAIRDLALELGFIR
jgi:phosphonate transport system substrate-binding protein